MYNFLSRYVQQMQLAITRQKEEDTIINYLINKCSCQWHFVQVNTYCTCSQWDDSSAAHHQPTKCQWQSSSSCSMLHVIYEFDNLLITSPVWVEFRAHKPPKHASTNSRRPKRCVFRWFHFTVVVQVEITGEIVIVRTVGNTRSHTVIPTFIHHCDRLNNRCHQAKNRQNRLNFPNQNRQITQ